MALCPCFPLWLIQTRPAFVSVTCDVGKIKLGEGEEVPQSIQMCRVIRKWCLLPVLLHLPHSSLLSQERAAEVLEMVKGAGVTNVLAMRGGER